MLSVSRAGSERTSRKQADGPDSSGAKTVKQMVISQKRSAFRKHDRNKYIESGEATREWGKLKVCGCSHSSLDRVGKMVRPALKSGFMGTWSLDVRSERQPIFEYS